MPLSPTEERRREQLSSPRFNTLQFSHAVAGEEDGKDVELGLIPRVRERFVTMATSSSWRIVIALSAGDCGAGEIPKPRPIPAARMNASTQLPPTMQRRRRVRRALALRVRLNSIAVAHISRQAKKHGKKNRKNQGCLRRNFFHLSLSLACARSNPLSRALSDSLRLPQTFSLSLSRALSRACSRSRSKRGGWIHSC